MVCPVCFIELPASGVCDEHGAAVKKTALPSVSAPEKPALTVRPAKGKNELDEFFVAAREYLNGLGLQHLTLRWDRGRNRLGSTRFIFGKAIEITLSRYMFEHLSDKERWNTLTHEAAHALLPHSEGHSRAWQQKHRELGGDGQRCADVSVREDAYKWVGTCPNGHTIKRHQKSKKMYMVSCSKCDPRWNANFMFKWKQNF